MGRFFGKVKTGKGRCSYCKGVFSKAGVVRHLATCAARPERLAESQDCFWLAVAGADDPRYWMYLEAPVTETLYGLDRFLRDIWLACCGHLSLFYIAGVEYLSDPADEDESDPDFYGDDYDDLAEKDMDFELRDVLREGMQFIHAYDFGSTTRLKLKVVGRRAGGKGDSAIMARNLAPDIECSYCANPAEKVCSVCQWDDSGWLCGKCAGEHEHGEGYLLPVVNSPRVGVCAYCGGDYEEDENE